MTRGWLNVGKHVPGLGKKSVGEILCTASNPMMRTAERRAKRGEKAEGSTRRRRPIFATIISQGIVVVVGQRAVFVRRGARQGQARFARRSRPLTATAPNDWR